MGCSGRFYAPGKIPSTSNLGKTSDESFYNASCDLELWTCMCWSISAFRN